MALLIIKSSYTLIKKIRGFLAILCAMSTLACLIIFSIEASYPIDISRLPTDQIKPAIHMFYFTVAGTAIEALSLIQPHIVLSNRRARLPNAISILVTSASLSCAIGVFIYSKRLADYNLTSSASSWILGLVITASVVNYIPIMISMFGSARWAVPSPFEPVSAIHKDSQTTQYELDHVASDDGRLARAYRASRHMLSSTTAVSAQILPGQTDSSTSQPGPGGQSSPARLGNSPIPAATPSFSPQIRHWTPFRSKLIALELLSLTCGSIFDMCFLIAYVLRFGRNSYPSTSAFGVQIASLCGKLLLLTSLVWVICRRVDMKAPILNLLTPGSLLMLVRWSLTPLWIAGVVLPFEFGVFLDPSITVVYITVVYNTFCLWFLSIAISLLVVRSFFKTAR